ncbi:MAG: hypothetical protein ACLSUM_08855 [Dysosmobacter welbionis]
MFTAILWDYDGTLANTPVKNIAVTRAVLGRLDPALLDPLPEALSSLAAYQAANYRWRNWRELYRHALHVPVDRLDEAGALWGPCQLADRTCPPSSAGFWSSARLAALAMGICSQNDSGNIRAALAATARRTALPPWWATRTGLARQKPDPPPSWPAWTGWGFGRGASPHRGPRRGHRLRPQCPGGPAGHGPGGGGGLRGRRLGRRPVRGFGGGGRRGRPPRGPAGSAGRPVTQQRPRREVPGGAAVCLPEVSACALFSGVL